MADKKIRTGPIRRRVNTFIRIFSHPFYIATAALSAIAFFYVFSYLVASSNNGIFLLFIPISLIYAIVATSGILFSISVFTIMHSVASRRSGTAGSIAGALIPAISGVIVSCGCSFPILASIMIFFGINTFEAVGLISIVNSYQIWIVCAMIAANLIMVYYLLGRSYGPHNRTKR